MCSGCETSARGAQLVCVIDLSRVGPINFGRKLELFVVLHIRLGLSSLDGGAGLKWHEIIISTSRCK